MVRMEEVLTVPPGDDLPAEDRPAKEVLGVADENLREYWDEMAKKYPAQVHWRTEQF